MYALLKRFKGDTITLDIIWKVVFCLFNRAVKHDMEQKEISCNQSGMLFYNIMDNGLCIDSLYETSYSF